VGTILWKYLGEFMNWTVKLIWPEHTTYDGLPVERREENYEIPFKFHSDIYYVHRKNTLRKRSPYVITKGLITGMWATNTVGVIFNNSNHISEHEFDRLFINKDEAIEFCLKKNEHRKVKIYGE
jgi:hypothetical protein